MFIITGKYLNGDDYMDKRIDLFEVSNLLKELASDSSRNEYRDPKYSADYINPKSITVEYDEER